MSPEAGLRGGATRHILGDVGLISFVLKEARMSVESHLAELQRRHEALKREVREAQLQPGFDELEVASLKRRKLQIKDEISRLMNQDAAVL
jgi:hypothetical protein